MPDVWAPRRVRLKRSVEPGDMTVTVFPSFAPPVPMLSKMGTELVTVTGTAGDVWSLAAPAVQHHDMDGYLREVTIRVLLAGSVTVTDQTGVAQHLVTREAEPEGEIEATWDIYTRTPALYTPNMKALPTRFTLYENSTGVFVPFFGGYIGRVADSQGRNGFHQLQITGRGAYITLAWTPITTSKTWPADTAEHTMIEEALALYAPYVSNSHEHILDGGLQIGAQMEGIQKTVRQLLDFVRSRGDSAGQALDWLVRTDPDAAFKLWLIIRSREPVIEIPITSLKAPTTFVQDYEHGKNMVSIKWQRGYVDEVLPGNNGAVRGIVRDYSSQIDNEPLAREVAGMILKNLATFDAISDGQVVLEHPKPIYKNGAPFPPHLVKAGWMANITGWTGGLTIATAPIKALTANHQVRHELELNLGELLEDDLQIAEQYFGKQTTILGSQGAGLIPLNIAPPEGMPNAVQSDAIGVGASGQTGWRTTGPDADIEQWTYVINGGDEVIVPGRQSPVDDMEINGRILGFKLKGDDKADPPAAGSITIEVYLAHTADLETGAIGTLVATIGLSDAFQDQQMLDEPPGTANIIFPVIAGDALIYKVIAADIVKSVGVTPLLQRTGGSGKQAGTGAPTIISQTATRDASTGVVTFTVVCDRPCHVQIEYGRGTGYMSKSQPEEIIKTTSNIGVILKPPANWRAIAKDDAGHTTVGPNQIL